MTTNKEVMARNIQYYMQKNNVTATELCKLLDIKQNTFSDWVNAKTYPRIDAIEKMAQYFHISKAFLVEDVREMEVFSEDERKMIIDYRGADIETQKMVKRILEYSKKEGENKNEMS